MITITVGNIVDQNMPPDYFTNAYCIYIVRDTGRTLYVGKAERQTAQARLLQHMAITGGADGWGTDESLSNLGRLIRENGLQARAWQIDLMTLQDCELLAEPGQHVPLTVDEAERRLIQRLAPVLNDINNTHPVTPPVAKRDRFAKARTLPRFAVEFLGDVSPNAKTQATYRYALQRFQLFAESAGLVRPASPFEPAQLYRNSLLDFVEWMRQDGARNNTIRTFVAVANQFVLWLETRQLIPGLDLSVRDMQLALEKAVGPHLRTIPHEHRRPDKSAAHLLDYYAKLTNFKFPQTARGRRQKLTSLRNHAIIQTLYSTAGRAGEVAALSRSAFEKLEHSAAGQEIPKQRPVAVEVASRAGKHRTIYLTSDAIASIRAYLAARDTVMATMTADNPVSDSIALFVKHDRRGTSALSTKTIWQVVNDAAKKVFGEDQNGRPVRRIGPSAFRHLRAQNLIDNGMSIETLQEILGLSNSLTTRRTYGSMIAPDRLADEMARFG